MVAGVRGARQADGFVPRAWLVLSESARAKGVDCMLGTIKEFLRGRLSDQHWLHGGFEVIDEVLSRFAHLLYPWRTTDNCRELRYQNFRAGKYYDVSCNTHTRAERGREPESKQNCNVYATASIYCTFRSREDQEIKWLYT